MDGAIDDVLENSSSLGAILILDNQLISWF
jgi:hypothetical protein